MSRHFSTAVFATCGMNIFIFTLATLLTMPKQVSRGHMSSYARRRITVDFVACHRLPWGDIRREWTEIERGEDHHLLDFSSCW